MSSDPVLLDTNVLVYAVFNDSAHHFAARRFIEDAWREGIRLCVTPQNLVEFFAVVTNPRRVTKPYTPIEALEVIDDVMRAIALFVLPFPSDLHLRWRELVRKQPVAGRKVFDLQLVATMLGNGVRRICTFNAVDFRPFAEVQVSVPKPP